MTGERAAIERYPKQGAAHAAIARSEGQIAGSGLGKGLAGCGGVGLRKRLLARSSGGECNWPR